MRQSLSPPAPTRDIIKGYKGLLFDLDGTLIDSMPLHHRAYQEVFAARGAALHWEIFMAHVGPPAAEAIPNFAAAIGVRLSTGDVKRVHQEKVEALDRLLRNEQPVKLAASEFLRYRQPHQKCGLVTSGNAAGVRTILNGLQWMDLFDVIITGDDVSKGKPSPEPYLLAARLLGLEPDACLAFEDTEAGLQSARSAGIHLCDVRKMNQAS